jgi:protein TonB
MKVINLPPPLLQSLGIHTGIALFIFLVMVIFNYEPEEKMEIEFDVIEKITIQKEATPIAINSPVKAPEPKVIKPVNQVYGVSRKSVTSSSASAVAAKQGNTLAKTPDDKTLDKDDPDSLPIPAAEYLVTSMPQVLSEIRPPYPPLAKKKGIEGAVVLEILIDAKGNVREAIILSGPGFGLEEAALDAIKKFRFKPAMIKKQSVAVKIKYAIRFVLE